MMELFNTLISRPFGWVLLQIITVVGSYGAAIIIFTVLTKLILLPLSIKSKKATLAQQRIQPKMKELEAKYKSDKQKYSEELQKLYNEEKINPMGGCLPLLIMFPIMMGLYQVITKPLTFLMGLNPEQITSISEFLQVTLPEGANAIGQEIAIANAMFGNIDSLYAQFADLPRTLINIDFNFLGMNLSGTPFFPTSLSTIDPLILIPLISGATAFLMSFISQKLNPVAAPPEPKPGETPNPMAGSMKMMLYTMPLISVWIGFSLPAGVGLYWIMSNVVGIVQEPALTYYFRQKQDRELEQREEQARLASASEVKKENLGTADNAKKHPKKKK